MKSDSVLRRETFHSIGVESWSSCTLQIHWDGCQLSAQAQVSNTFLLFEVAETAYRLHWPRCCCCLFAGSEQRDGASI